MFHKRKNYIAQDYIHIGMSLFLMSALANMLVDSRLIGAFFSHIISNPALLGAIQGGAAGATITMTCASIYYNVRGLVMLRGREC